MVFSLFLCVMGVEELWIVLEFWVQCVSKNVFVVWLELGSSFMLILVYSTFRMFDVFAFCFLLILYVPSLNTYEFMCE